MTADRFEFIQLWDPIDRHVMTAVIGRKYGQSNRPIKKLSVSIGDYRVFHQNTTDLILLPEELYDSPRWTLGKSCKLIARRNVNELHIRLRGNMNARDKDRSQFSFATSKKTICDTSGYFIRVKAPYWGPITNKPDSLVYKGTVLVVKFDLADVTFSLMNESHYYSFTDYLTDNMPVQYHVPAIKITAGSNLMVFVIVREPASFIRCPNATCHIIRSTRTQVNVMSNRITIRTPDVAATYLPREGPLSLKVGLMPAKKKSIMVVENSDNGIITWLQSALPTRGQRNPPAKLCATLKNQRGYQEAIAIVNSVRVAAYFWGASIKNGPYNVNITHENVEVGYRSEDPLNDEDDVKFSFRVSFPYLFSDKMNRFDKIGVDWKYKSWQLINTKAAIVYQNGYWSVTHGETCSIVISPRMHDGMFWAQFNNVIVLSWTLDPISGKVNGIRLYENSNKLLFLSEYAAQFFAANDIAVTMLRNATQFITPDITMEVRNI